MRRRIDQLSRPLYPQRAVALFAATLEQQPQNAAALEGRCAPESQLRIEPMLTTFCLSAAAQRLIDAQAATTRCGAASALRGDRPALPQVTVPLEEAAEQLLAAEALLQAQPGLEGAKCCVIEALILCSRYDEALRACQRLTTGSLDGLYLRAEAQWMAGCVDAAATTLGPACAASSKCAGLARQVAHLRAALTCIDDATDRGDVVEARHLLTALMEQPRLQRTHLLAALLRRRAALQTHAPLALADLAESLALHNSNVEALLQRAELHRAVGDFEASFLDIHAAWVQDAGVRPSSGMSPASH